MAKRIAIIQGHPDPAARHFCHALADAYAEGPPLPAITSCISRWRGSGFRVLRTAQEFESAALPETLIPARDVIMMAEHLVIVFPLWLGTMPAILKAFLEQIMRPGIAFAYRKRGFPKRLLAGRSARIVVTMGMPAFLYRWYFGGHGLRGLERSILRFTGIKPVREMLFGGVGDADEARRRRWLDRMRDYGRRGV